MQQCISNIVVEGSVKSMLLIFEKEIYAQENEFCTPFKLHISLFCIVNSGFAKSRERRGAIKPYIYPQMNVILRFAAKSRK